MIDTPKLGKGRENIRWMGLERGGGYGLRRCPHIFFWLVCGCGYFLNNFSC